MNYFYRVVDKWVDGNIMANGNRWRQVQLRPHPILFRATQYGTHFKEPIPAGNTRRGNPNITLLTIKLDLTKNVQQNLDGNCKYHNYPKCACHCSLHTLISKEPCQQSPWSFDTSKGSLGTQDRNAKKSQEKVFVYVVRFRCFFTANEYFIT